MPNDTTPKNVKYIPIKNELINVQTKCVFWFDSTIRENSITRNANKATTITIMRIQYLTFHLKSFLLKKEGCSDILDINYSLPFLRLFNESSFWGYPNSIEFLFPVCPKIVTKKK